MMLGSRRSDIKITHTIIKRQGTKIGITFRNLPQHKYIPATAMPLARLQGKFHRILGCAVVGPQPKTLKLRIVLHGP